MLIRAIKKRKATQREQLLFSILFLVFLLVLARKGVQQLITNSHRLNEAISISEKELARLNGVLKQARVIDLEYDEVFSGYKGLNSSDNLLQEIDNIARKLNLNIFSIKPTLTEDTDKYKVYTIKIESRDEVAAFIKFLYTLTEGLKGIGVQHLQINAQNRSELPQINTILKAIIFKNTDTRGF